MRVRINEAITEDSVLLYGDDGKLAEVTLVEALRLARERSMELVEEYERPRQLPRAAVVCRLLHVPSPLLWESGEDLRLPLEPTFDLNLWFTTDHCDGRHYILGNAHTFRGRLSAWCPSKKRGFAVSKSEMQECSNETTYYVRGFLSGQDVDAPRDADGHRLLPDDPEYVAWARASELFQQTGVWNTRFRLCERCGARLLPSNPEPTCWDAHDAPRTTPRSGSRAGT